MTDGCYVTIYKDDNFGGKTLTLRGPAEFRNLKNLPGADEDWGDSIGSLRTGPNTWVTVYNDEDFNDDHYTYGPGSEIRGLPNDDDIDSIRIFDSNPEA